MGIDRSSGSSDESDGTDQASDQPSSSERRPLPDRPGEAEANQKPTGATTETTAESDRSTGGSTPAQTTPKWDEQGGESRDGISQKDRNESVGTPGVADMDRRQGGEHKAPDADTYASPMERRPSYGAFGNLAEEFEARAKSKEFVKQHASAADDRTSESGTMRSGVPSKLDEESIRKQIDPFAPSVSKAEGRKEPFQRTIRDKDADWTDGVDAFDDLPTGEKLTEPDEDKRSRADQFRTKGFQKVDTITSQAEKFTKKAADFFDPPPSAHAETAFDSAPKVVDSHHAGIDPGSAATAVLAVGIVSAELLRWGRGKIRERREAE
ncbi:hypothetical protein [Actinoallomurus sp. NPDC050550]|uniref:hypothetical protein n=1 Tax=Actinoallomurus sp. NPDC050550 TaxID=3154937 RepID=UPI0033FD49CD